MHPNPNPLDRRQFLKLGALGSTLLAGAGLVGSIQGCNSNQVQSSTPSQPLQFEFLREKDAIILGALSPVVLKGNFPEQAQEQQVVLDQLLLDIDQFLVNSSEFAHGQVHQLFDLLYFSLSRITLAGLWSSWEEASEEELQNFLNGWRDSRFNLLRQGYVLLTQLPTLAFYYQPNNWTDDIYPGPPQHIPS